LLTHPEFSQGVFFGRAIFDGILQVHQSFLIDLWTSCRPSGTDSKELKQLNSADSGKVLQNPQPPRNKIEQKKGTP